jgi:hypothetical protein
LKRKATALLSALVGLLTNAGSQGAVVEPLANSDLGLGFARPPASARPWVYWFPLDGNLTREGITADLEAMARVGIGGVLYMETDQGAPKGPARFGGPQWREMFKHICAEAKRLGLEVNMHNNAGWTGSGGPWITPELSMQRVVWTETKVSGSQRFDATLPQPTATKDFYRDIALFAYPTPATPFVLPQLRNKSGAFAARGEVSLRTDFPPLPEGAAVPRDQIINLTGKLSRDGRLAWDVPAGNWTLLRMGCTTTGKDNHPAPLEGRGLECDKLSKEATEIHFDALMGKLIADNPELVGEQRTLVSTHIDSWEIFSQNWTPKFREEFRKLRGYDPFPLLPVMSGRVVDGLEISERFLWDVRQTISDLLCENYAGHFRMLAHRYGIRLSIEAYDKSPSDDLTYAGRADEPMAEFWAWPYHDFAWSCTEMASAAHVYGKRIVGAEAFTSNQDEKWQSHPATLKSLGDWAFCEGVNRFVFHRYALQPWTKPDRPPGMSMGPWGLHYERTQTWWEQSRAWHEYLARCQFLLQQGLFVADLCFLTPEGSPQRFKSPVKFGFDRPGYNFDGCPPEVVLTRMAVRDGRLVLPDGMSYRMLVLPQVETMTPALLRKIRDLVQAGATVLGGPPVKSPSLEGFPQCDQEVKALARELWGEGVVPAKLTERAFGLGRVFWGGEVRKKPDRAYDAVTPFGSARMIWFNEGNPAVRATPGKRYFRRQVNVDAASPIASARFVITADNSFECWVNGGRAGGAGGTGRAFTLNVDTRIRPGANLITVAAVKGPAVPGPAALVGALIIKFRDGRTQVVATDGTWEAARTVPDNWMEDATAAAAWSAALDLGPMGMAPWGAIEEDAEADDAILNIDVASRVLAKMGVSPDFSGEMSGATVALRYIHKRLGDADVYFVANPKPRDVEARCTFRVSGKQPELWWPDSGRTEMATTFASEGDGTTVPLRLEPNGSVFVMFRKASGGQQPASVGKNWAEFRPLQELAGPWELSFPPHWGAPDRVTLDRLASWSEHRDPGVKYFSGTATYRTRFDWLADSRVASGGSRVFLDLGRVAVMAEVKLNGKDLGILWKAPFRVDISEAVKPGDNALEVRVVNLWINRMIGDEQLPEDSDRRPNGTLNAWPAWLDEGKPSPSGRFTFTSWRLWKKTNPLVESGLLGPVTLQAAERVPVK